MSFNINIPQPNDDLSVSQGQIKNNFLTSNTSFGVNHYPFNDGGANNGKHKRVDIVKGAIPASANGEGNLYTRQPGAYSDLYYTQDASSNEYQLTRVITTSFTKFATNTALSVGVGGWTFLPGGMLYQYGFYDAGAGGLGASGTITFPVSFTNPAYSVQLTQVSKVGGTSSTHALYVKNASVAVNTFQWQIDGATTAVTGFYWVAIGV